MTKALFRTTTLFVASQSILAGYTCYGTGGDGPVVEQFAELAAPPVTAQASPSGLSLTPIFTTAAAARMPDRTERRSLTLADMGVATAPAGGASDDPAALAKKLANPIASLISVPFQYNADFNAGVSGNAHRSFLNIQPVIPFDLNQDWNLITRTIVPVVYQEQYAPGQSTNWGLGDTTASFFFSPKAAWNGWIWGVGPVAYLPTATDTTLGSGQWGGGVTAVALRQENGWTVGALTNHIWSVCGDGDRPHINATFIQPFLAYTWPTATTLTLNTESTYDWRTSQWTMPVNLTVTQVFKMGGMPMSIQCGPRYYLEGPDGAPEWGFRFALTFLFPR